MRRVSAGVLVALTVAGAAQAADLPLERRSAPRRADQGAATLILTATGDDAGSLRFTCDRASGDISVSPEVAIKGFKAGDPTAITLESPGGRAVVAARIVHDKRSGDMRAMGKLSRSAGLVRLLTRGTRLDVEVADKFLSVPLNRRNRDALARFRAQCPSLR
ncbi:hypothetical protein [Microvirga rosea]|uniref:hypothetical protein n=1 Tax=Microvirga rosea TaxID=2715425 RepID=UPI001D0B81AE|nr:hypothetical protein [Microvirga rosea]MCB8819125.1 hypothetical protein [Microvirga rosea]